MEQIDGCWKSWSDTNWTNEEPTITRVCEWVKTSWQSAKDETVVRSFKKWGISNALDGSEDDLLYEQSEDSDTSDSEELSFINVDSSDAEFLGFPDD